MPRSLKRAITFLGTHCTDWQSSHVEVSTLGLNCKHVGQLTVLRYVCAYSQSVFRHVVAYLISSTSTSLTLWGMHLTADETDMTD